MRTRRATSWRVRPEIGRRSKSRGSASPAPLEQLHRVTQFASPAHQLCSPASPTDVALACRLRDCRREATTATGGWTPVPSGVIPSHRSVTPSAQAAVPASLVSCEQGPCCPRAVPRHPPPPAPALPLTRRSVAPGSASSQAVTSIPPPLRLPGSRRRRSTSISYIPSRLPASCRSIGLLRSLMFVSKVAAVPPPVLFVARFIPSQPNAAFVASADA